MLSVAESVYGRIRWRAIRPRYGGRAGCFGLAYSGGNFNARHPNDTAAPNLGSSRIARAGYRRRRFGAAPIRGAASYNGGILGESMIATQRGA